MVLVLAARGDGFYVRGARQRGDSLLGYFAAPCFPASRRGWRGYFRYDTNNSNGSLVFFIQGFTQGRARLRRRVIVWS